MKHHYFLMLILLFFFANTSPAQAQIDSTYLHQARNGDVDAMHVIASEYQDAGMTYSAIQWYTKAAEKGYVYSQSALGELYEKQDNPDYEKAAYWYEKAAVQSYNWAQFRLGHFYHYGIGVAVDDKLAAKWLKAAAEQGFCYGLPQYEYGKYYASAAESKYWLLKSAEAGYKEALTAIGEGYQTGSIGTDADSAFHYYQLAADKGSADAMWELSECYALGNGCPQSYWKALGHYYIAAQKGSSKLDLDKALNPMRSAYVFNPETQQNELKENASYFWYKDMIYKDDLASGYKIMQCYMQGKYGVAVNYDEASTWCEALAKAGLFETQVLLARTYERIDDIENAKYWYRQGANNTEYMRSETTYEEYLSMKKECQDALERLSK